MKFKKIILIIKYLNLLKIEKSKYHNLGLNLK